MIRLLSLSLERLRALHDDPTRIDGVAVVDGGLPPAAVLANAEVALGCGRDPMWFSPFVFVDATAGHIVGSGIFKGEPDDGWVEIGYGIAVRCEGRGYATDGAFALVRLAFEQPSVRAVYAETATINVASRRVVQKVGFTHAGLRFCDDDGMVDCWFVEAPA